MIWSLTETAPVAPYGVVSGEDVRDELQRIASEIVAKNFHMVTIYRVSVDANRCQWVLPSDPEFIRSEQWKFDATPKLGGWSPPRFYIHNPVAPRSNFFILAPGVLCFDETARNNADIAGFLEWAGEILPLEMESGETLYALNVLECVNALDPIETKWRTNPVTGNRVAITRYVFLSDRLSESVLFKVPETRVGEIFTFSGKFPNPDDEFMEPYKRSGLDGLAFQQIT